MFITMLKAKIHRCRVTAVKPDYEGSLTVDSALAKAAGLLEYEKILVADLRNGERFETYVILGPPGSGEICVNGAAARLCKRNDLLIIMAFVSLEPEKADRWKPVVVHVDRNNRPEK